MDIVEEQGDVERERDQKAQLMDAEYETESGGQQPFRGAARRGGTTRWTGFGGVKRGEKERPLAAAESVAPVVLGDRVSHQEGGLAPEEELPQLQRRAIGALRREEGVLRVRGVEYATAYQVPGERRKGTLLHPWQGSRNAGTGRSEGLGQLHLRPED